ncbi:MAG: hypothetical protein ABL957_16665 [Parvularculaceae bacterium]
MNRAIVLAVLLATLAACGKKESAQATATDSAGVPADVAAEVTGALPMSAAAPFIPAAAPAGQRARGDILRLDPAVIVDATGFEQPMGAVTLFVPHGWRAQGGVLWASDYQCTNGYNFAWSAASPDGAMTLGVAPQTGWAYASSGAASPQPGCPVMTLASARAYLEASVRNFIPDARILDYRDRPDLVAEAGIRAQRTQMPLGETQVFGEGGEVLFAFASGGRDMRGSLAAVVQFSRMVTDMTSMYANDPTIAQMPNAATLRTESVTAFAHPGFYATAPNGQLNLGFFEALRKTMVANPQWLARISKHNTAIGRVAIEESRKRAGMIARSNEEISRIRQETWDTQQKSADRRAREFGELIKGVETYADADAPGGTVELSAQQRNAWRLNDGSYVLTDDPSFDPWRDLQMEGRQLEAVQ